MVKGLSIDDKISFERNIKINYIMGSLMWGRFFIPVLALFYIASQVPLAQFAIIMAVFSLTIFLLEIPTGVLADLLGKKKTLLLSRFMYVIEIILIAFFNGFWPFLIAKIISGIGVSLSSGTGSAFLYDTLKRLGKEKEHKKISGTLNAISSTSMAFVFIIGAFLFTINYKLPAYISLPFITFGFILTFFYKEPYPPHKTLTIANSWKHLKEGLTYFKKQKFLVYLGLLSLAVGAAISISLSMSSAYFGNILFPLTLIGVVSFIGSLLNAYTSKKAHRFEERLGEKRSLFLVQAGVVLSVFLMALSLKVYGFLFYFLIPFFQGFFDVISADYANRHSKSSHRATTLSIVNMFDNIGVFLLFPAVGYLTSIFSLGIAFALFGIILLVYLAILTIMFGKTSVSQ